MRIVIAVVQSFIVATKNKPCGYIHCMRLQGVELRCMTTAQNVVVSMQSMRSHRSSHLLHRLMYHIAWLQAKMYIARRWLLMLSLFGIKTPLQSYTNVKTSLHVVMILTCVNQWAHLKIMLWLRMTWRRLKHDDLLLWQVSCDWLNSSIVAMMCTRYSVRRCLSTR